jgi:hypothetical protein
MNAWVPPYQAGGGFRITVCSSTYFPEKEVKLRSMHTNHQWMLTTKINYG